MKTIGLKYLFWNEEILRNLLLVGVFLGCSSFIPGVYVVTSQNWWEYSDSISISFFGSWPWFLNICDRRHACSQFLVFLSHFHFSPTNLGACLGFPLFSIPEMEYFLFAVEIILGSGTRKLYLYSSVWCTGKSIIYWSFFNIWHSYIPSNIHKFEDMRRGLHI